MHATCGVPFFCPLWVICMPSTPLTLILEMWCSQTEHGTEHVLYSSLFDVSLSTYRRFFSADEFILDAKWLIDPKHLFVGPRIGEGAHAKVYEGKYKNQTVAIKIVHKGETPEEIAKREARFAREVAMLSRVQHKNLVKFIGACKEPVMVMVTELLLGGTLRKYLLNMRPRRLDMGVAIGFALDIARAMECLHSHGIIHRDLKPGTITFIISLLMSDI
ncbi:hypothetical protein SLEP1_g13226 [Rubroshorea leprosula]|uniref:Protein kinase domain-containing protein n=1 Tax=Rubroshorea leprosula TaxID=152421 RepID=A0AAV5IF54_9ROSI|nr:hypothetical protein SLEP1_g13226 [Rubroshorea leprosula]